MSKRKNKAPKVARTKPMKIAALIFAAIKNLRETKGSTSCKIVDYITLASELPQGRIKPQVKAALKRGIEYGLLKRFRGHYFLPSDDELARADRIATRFAKLPIASIPAYETIYKKTAGPKTVLQKNKKKNKLLPVTLMSPMNVPRISLISNIVERKNVRKSRSVPLSLTSSTATGQSYYHREKQSRSFDSDDDQ